MCKSHPRRPPIIERELCLYLKLIENFRYFALTCSFLLCRSDQSHAHPDRPDCHLPADRLALPTGAVMGTLGPGGGIYVTGNQVIQAQATPQTPPTHHSHAPALIKGMVVSGAGSATPTLRRVTLWVCGQLVLRSEQKINLNSLKGPKFSLMEGKL